MNLDRRELATVLAALRTAQEDYPVFCQMPHFTDEDIEPPSLEEIDALCERINCGD
jgi:hypothetical protein